MSEATRRERPGKVAILRAAVEVMGEDGYEGASIRDMAARSGVSVAAIYYHFPSKHDMLREFLDEAYDITLARIRRRMAAADASPVAQLDEIVSTLIASHLHDDYAQLAAKVAFREFRRLNPPEREAIDAKRIELLRLVEKVIVGGIETGDFRSSDARETARAIVVLSTTLVESFPEMHRSMAEVIELYQGFARAIARGD